jgi:hypothetical protein
MENCIKFPLKGQADGSKKRSTKIKFSLSVFRSVPGSQQQIIKQRTNGKVYITYYSRLSGMARRSEL